MHHDHIDTPLWFGASGQNRFDLNRHGSAGTCYVADDPYGALLETALRDIEPTGSLDVPPLAPAEVQDLRVVAYTARASSAADLTGTATLPPDTHTAFGVTDELGTTADYELTQQWAQAFHAEQLPAIRYRLRRGNGRLGAALFGTAGAQSAPNAEISDITIGSIRSWREQHTAVLAAPTDTDLDWVDET